MSDTITFANSCQMVTPDVHFGARIIANHFEYGSTTMDEKNLPTLYKEKNKCILYCWKIILLQSYVCRTVICSRGIKTFTIYDAQLPSNRQKVWCRLEFVPIHHYDEVLFLEWISKTIMKPRPQIFGILPYKSCLCSAWLLYFHFFVFK